MNNYLKFIRNEFPKSVNLGKLDFTEHVFKKDNSKKRIQHMKLLSDHKNHHDSIDEDEKIQFEKLDLIEGGNNFVNVSFAIIFLFQSLTYWASTFDQIRTQAWDTLILPMCHWVIKWNWNVNSHTQEGIHLPQKYVYMLGGPDVGWGIV